MRNRDIVKEILTFQMTDSLTDQVFRLADLKGLTVVIEKRK